MDPRAPIKKSRGRPAGKKDAKKRKKRDDAGKKRGPRAANQLYSEGWTKPQIQSNFVTWATTEISASALNFEEDEEFQEAHCYLSVKE